MRSSSASSTLIPATSGLSAVISSSVEKEDRNLMQSALEGVKRCGDFVSSTAHLHWAWNAQHAERPPTRLIPLSVSTTRSRGQPTAQHGDPQQQGGTCLGASTGCDDRVRRTIRILVATGRRRRARVRGAKVFRVSPGRRAAGRGTGPGQADHSIRPLRQLRRRLT